MGDMNSMHIVGMKGECGQKQFLFLFWGHPVFIIFVVVAAVVVVVVVAVRSH